MRVDKWLSAVNVVKRRTIATDMLKSGVVYVNGMTKLSLRVKKRSMSKSCDRRPTR